MRLASLSREARRLGLTTGLSLADARARIPDLWVEEMDGEADAVLLDAIAEDCDRFSPIVMVDPPDGLTLDIAGCGHFFSDESELRLTLSQRLHRAGLHARCVIAGAPDAARALARHGRIAVVATGQEAQAVRPLPVAALGLEESAHSILARAGLKTIAAIADRPSQVFSARFGEQMMLRLRRLQGLEPAPLTPRRAIPALWTERRFAEPIGRAEDIAGVLGELVQEACARLAERREGGRTFEAAFHRSDGRIRRLCVETGRPQRDPKAVLRLFQEKFDALADPLDPGFGFDLIRLSLLVVERMDVIQTGLDGRAVEDDAVADLIDRLATRFGPQRVVRFAPEDSHDPERCYRVLRPGQDRVKALRPIKWRKPEAGDPPSRPLQMFHPPQSIRVAMAEVPDGPPRRFAWRRCSHDIVLAEGPERIAAEWWRDPGGGARDYFRVEDAEGRRFWLFRAGEYSEDSRWYLHGIFP